MGGARDPEDPDLGDTNYSVGPLRRVAVWAAGLNNLTKLVLAITGLLVAVGSLIVATGLGSGNPGAKSVETTTPASADHCATNHYTVDLPDPGASTGVYESASTDEFIKWKHDGDKVTGPNSRNNYANGYRAVYTPGARDDIGWIRIDHLRYEKCTRPGSFEPR